ncbi:transcriptional regulator [Streptomyces yokosukanensis]|uniref:Transcriptional regulator n=1 Tax=Streptomyces yokosukanensis TaxID=67386 RepID=A0A101P1P1_9ACTN|nr:MerR family transcriptional regulator [Streptomyces yokosukanensis]KUN03263.1 transcriptional regulator [Streptomyces yokosukanensis]
MTTDAGQTPLTIDELAARAGVTVRTVRFYGSRGLLPPPVIGPRRVGHYGPEHVARLALIEELQRQGMTLAAIERYLRQLPADLTPHDLAIHRAVVASWAPDAMDTVSRRELERRAGRSLTADDLERLMAMNVVMAAQGGRAGEECADGSGDGDSDGSEHGDAFRVDAGLLRLGVELLDVPLSQEVILAARKVLIEHSRAAAHALSQLFRGEVAERNAQDVRSLSAHMHPLVVQALLTTFQRSLREELSGWVSGSGAD